MYIFGSWLYSNATIYLKRKHDKYLEFVNYYNLKQENTVLTKSIAQGDLVM